MQYGIYEVANVIFNDFSAIIEETKFKYPIWFGLESDPIGTDIDIIEIENRLSVLLPEEYKLFVKNYGGGYFAFINIFSVHGESEWNIIQQNNKIGLVNSHNFLAVSDNGVGDFYGFEIRNGVCSTSIKFYHHELNQLESTEYENLFDYALKMGLKQS